MKEFKKWDKKEYPLPATTERGPIGRDALKQRKHAWRAALEWVSTRSGTYYVHISLIEEIKEELSGE